MSAKRKSMADKVSLLREELTDILEWATIERAPLRDIEIESIRKCLEATKEKPQPLSRGRA